MTKWRSMMASLKEVLMVGAVACLVVGLTPGTVLAQGDCEVGATKAANNTNGFESISNTHQLGSGCNSMMVQSRAWFEGWYSPVACLSGSGYVGNGTCEDSYGPYMGQGEAVAHAKTALCGYWTARHSMHAYWVPDDSWWYNFFPSGSYLGGYDCNTGDECESWEIWDEQTQRCVPYNSPILVPLTRSQDYHLTSVEDGVQFDMDGNGTPERTAWTARGSRLAFLALDVDGDGRITSGKELIGDRTVEGKGNGFAALAALAEAEKNRISKITEDQELFGRLLLWEDANHDGVSQPSELQPATNVVAEIGLGYAVHNRRDRFGNKFRFQGWASVRTAPGKNETTGHADGLERNIKLYDVFFKAQQ
jgi:hypothetical protein